MRGFFKYQYVKIVILCDSDKLAMEDIRNSICGATATACTYPFMIGVLTFGSCSSESSCATKVCESTGHSSVVSYERCSGAPGYCWGRAGVLLDRAGGNDCGCSTRSSWNNNGEEFFAYSSIRCEGTLEFVNDYQYTFMLNCEFCNLKFISSYIHCFSVRCFGFEQVYEE